MDSYSGTVSKQYHAEISIHLQLIFKTLIIEMIQGTPMIRSNPVRAVYGERAAYWLPASEECCGKCRQAVAKAKIRAKGDYGKAEIAKESVKHRRLCALFLSEGDVPYAIPPEAGPQEC